MEKTRSGRPGPYFFLSYAHTPKNSAQDLDPNLWVKKLYDGLCEHIMQLTDLPPGVKAGFLDQGMTVGARWTAELSENLARCRVFVPLYSPRYFMSQQCGREWWVFSQRQADNRTRAGSSWETSIVPALWVPVEPAQMPPVARDLQFNHATFGENYADEGLYGLTKLRYLRDEYERAVYRLAKQIVKVAKETELADGESYEEYESLPSAFGSPDDAPTLKIVTVAPRLEQLQQGQRRFAPYGPLAVDWNPYHPDITRPLAAIAADLARLQGFKADVGDFDDAAEAMLEVGHYSDGPVLLLIDPWALRDPQRRERLSQVDAVAPPWTTVMVPWNRNDPDNGKEGAPDPAELEEVTPRLLRLGRSASRMSVSGVGTPEAFREVFSLVVHQASAEFARLGSGPPPSRPRLYGPFSSPEAHGDRSA